ncbi:uncharacterized protein LOC113285724 [Papaver somniferum]|uniref:uncharacterized protein LOC113285724 n=1 Tax=Papaver somniferum TaxID=3469 RepID=UPI000E704E15|nr:uncharacterized protein LOC113285724 [Papaver somniferum]
MSKPPSDDDNAYQLLAASQKLFALALVYLHPYFYLPLQGSSFDQRNRFPCTSLVPVLDNDFLSFLLFSYLWSIEELLFNSMLTDQCSYLICFRKIELGRLSATIPVLFMRKFLVERFKSQL